MSKNFLKILLVGYCVIVDGGVGMNEQGAVPERDYIFNHGINLNFSSSKQMSQLGLSMPILSLDEAFQLLKSSKLKDVSISDIYDYIVTHVFLDCCRTDFDADYRKNHNFSALARKIVEVDDERCSLRQALLQQFLIWFSSLRSTLITCNDPNVKRIIFSSSTIWQDKSEIQEKYLKEQKKLEQKIEEKIILNINKMIIDLIQKLERENEEEKPEKTKYLKQYQEATECNLDADVFKYLADCCHEKIENRNVKIAFLNKCLYQFTDVSGLNLPECLHVGLFTQGSQTRAGSFTDQLTRISSQVESGLRFLCVLSDGGITPEVEIKKYLLGCMEDIFNKAKNEFLDEEQKLKKNEVQAQNDAKLKELGDYKALSIFAQVNIISFFSELLKCGVDFQNKVFGSFANRAVLQLLGQILQMSAFSVSYFWSMFSNLFETYLLKITLIPDIYNEFCRGLSDLQKTKNISFQPILDFMTKAGVYIPESYKEDKDSSSDSSQGSDSKDPQESNASIQSESDISFFSFVDDKIQKARKCNIVDRYNLHIESNKTLSGAIPDLNVMLYFITEGCEDVVKAASSPFARMVIQSIQSFISSCAKNVLDAVKRGDLKTIYKYLESFQKALQGFYTVTGHKTEAALAGYKAKDYSQKADTVQEAWIKSLFSDKHTQCFKNLRNENAFTNFFKRNIATLSKTKVNAGSIFDYVKSLKRFIEKDTLDPDIASLQSGNIILGVQNKTNIILGMSAIIYLTIDCLESIFDQENNEDVYMFGYILNELLSNIKNINKKNIIHVGSQVSQDNFFANRTINKGTKECIRDPRTETIVYKLQDFIIKKYNSVFYGYDDEELSLKEPVYSDNNYLIDRRPLSTFPLNPDKKKCIKMPFALIDNGLLIHYLIFPEPGFFCKFFIKAPKSGIQNFFGKFGAQLF